MRLAAFLLLAVLLAAPAVGQGFRAFNGRNHPELDWRVARTEHFEIVYPEHLAGIEAEAAAVAEASYAALSENLGVTFDRPIRIYLSDEDEIANGFAVNVGRAGFTNVWVGVNEAAQIWTGDVTWLRKVIAHELVHLFHYRAVQGSLGFFDNLFGNPLPRFWTEGLAQYETEDWDAQRGDRWLRTAVFEDRMSYEDGTSPLNGRLLYAAGNSQVRYLAETRGDSTIAAVLAHREPVLPGIRVHDFYDAFEEVTGESYRDFYAEWRKHVNVYYNTLAGQMERTDSLGAALRVPGDFLYDVAYSPDTSRVAALVLTSVVRPVRRLAVIEGLTDTTVARRVRVVAEGGLAGQLAWGPEGERIAYARRVRGENGSLVFDLFLHDLRTRETRRLTRSRRASSPTFAPDGRRLAFVGAEGGTADVFVLDLETGAEARLTRFAGGTLMTALRWSPDGRRLAASVFGDEREIVLIDAATGAAERVSVSGADDRGPVWSPDGRRLAYTSLRDDVPNVFVLDLEPAETAEGNVVRATHASPLQAGTIPTPVERRVTYLFTGARVTDWLPPDSAHAHGRLLVVSTETKRSEEAFLIDAARRPEARPPAVAPPAYAAWTEHRPPETIPDRIAPDSALVRERRGYRSLANLTHVTSFALPYTELDFSDYGVTGATLWVEPLGKHLLTAFGSVSIPEFADNTLAFVSYTNAQLAPTLTLNLYRYPSPARWYGTSLLVEDLAGGDLSATLPLDLTTAPFTSTSTSLRLRYAYADPFDDAGFEDVETTSGLPQPEAGYRAEVRAGFTWRRQRPYRYNDLHPLDGTGLRLRVTAGLPALGSDAAFVRPDAQAVWVSPQLGIGRFYLYGRAQAQFGETLAQDVIGLSRYDDVDLQIPFTEPVTLSDAERVRGYRRFAVGDRVLFGTAEYRLPPVFDLQTRLLGFLELGRVAPALFVDAGAVWTGAGFGDAIRRTGVGTELKNRVSLGGFPLIHALGVAQRWDLLGESVDLDDLDVYYRLQATLPF